MYLIIVTEVLSHQHIVLIDLKNERSFNCLIVGSFNRCTEELANRNI